MTLNDARVTTLLGWLEMLEYHCDMIIQLYTAENELADSLDNLVEGLEMSMATNHHLYQKETLVGGIREYFELINFNEIEDDLSKHLYGLREHTRA